MRNLDTETEILDKTVAALREHGLEVGRPSSNPGRHDVDLDLAWGAAEPARFSVLVKRAIRPATAATALHELSRWPNAMLIAHQIGGRTADLARQLGVSFADAAGNAWIRTPSFLIDVRGRQNEPERVRLDTGFTKVELRVVLALMAAPTLIELPVRELGETVGISHGSAATCLKKLRSRGYLGDGGLRRGEALLEEWTQSYLARQGTHRSSRVAFLADAVHVLTALEDVGDVQVSGEAAAEALGWPIRGRSLIVYAPAFASVSQALRPTSRATSRQVEIRLPVPAPSDNDRGLAASALIRADLLASADPRQIEVAQQGWDSDPNLRHLRGIA